MREAGQQLRPFISDLHAVAQRISEGEREVVGRFLMEVVKVAERYAQHHPGAPSTSP
ncbi:MAG: hypothetical protein M3281_06990 [Chloroflexota bacterium]|nr:hypothetical protein [Chloroflexota bacterium]